MIRDFFHILPLAELKVHDLFVRINSHLSVVIDYPVSNVISP